MPLLAATYIRVQLAVTGVIAGITQEVEVVVWSTNCRVTSQIVGSTPEYSTMKQVLATDPWETVTDVPPSVPVIAEVDT